MKKFILAVLLCMIISFLTHPVFARDMLQIKGSDTLINLVQRLSEEYMEAYPNRYIAVTGGGSGTGIAALINDKCDIANASRKIKQKEIDLLTQRSTFPLELIIAVDGLCIITNKDNNIDEIRCIVQYASSLGANSLIIEGKTIESLISRIPACVECGTWFGELEPKYFNKNCPHCKGKGCKLCNETGYYPIASNVTWEGLIFPEILKKSVSELVAYFSMKNYLFQSDYYRK